MGGRQEVIFRKWYFSVFALTGAAGAIAGFIAISVAHPGASDYAGALIMLAFWYFFWILGWESAIRITTSGVIVDNLVLRHVIPWPDFAGFEVSNGLQVRLAGDGSVGSVVYGGSVIGAVLGYRWTREQAQRMNDAAERLSALQVDGSSANAVYHSHVRVNPWPPLATLAGFEVIAMLVNVL